MGISGNFTMLWFHNAHFVPVAGSVRNGLAPILHGFEQKSSEAF
jgi:hypothetical protein